MAVNFTPISNSGQAPASKINFTPIQAPQQDSTLNKVADTALAFGSSAKQGVLESVSDMANLASTIVSHTLGKITPDFINKTAANLSGKISSAYNKFKDFETSDKTEETARIKHTVAAGIGGGTGYVTGSFLSGQPIFKAVDTALSPVLKNVSPILTKSPALQGALEQGSTGAVIGAASNPEHPIRGALSAMTFTAPIGAAAGQIGYRAQLASKIINKRIQQAIDTGVDTGSHEFIEKVQGDLANEGLNIKKLHIKAEANKAVENQLNSIRPDKYDINTSPAKILTDKISTNAKAVEETRKALYAPIDNAPQTFSANIYKSTLENIGTSIPKKIGLPTQNLPEQATLSDMLSYRRLLDGKIQQAKLAFANSRIASDEITPYYQLRQAINNDIKQSAQSIGLGDQLNKAELHYKTNVKPFQIYDSKSGTFTNNPDIEDNVWTQVAKQLKTRRPNLVQIKNITKTIGQDGKELMGWAKIESNYRRSFSGDPELEGTFNAKKFNGYIAQDRAIGLDKELYTQDHEAVIKGIQKTLYSAEQLQNLTAPKKGMITKGIESALSSRMGILFLKHVGEQKGTTAGDLIKKFITGTLASRILPQNQENQ